MSIGVTFFAVLCAAAVSAQTFNSNLVRNNNADQGTAYWSRSSGGLSTTSRSCSGKVGSRMFDGGTSSYSASYQDIYIGGTSMSSGDVGYFFSARLGGLSFQSDRASAQVQFLSSSRSVLVNSPTLGPVTRSDRGWDTELQYKSTQSCSTHKSAYYARVWLRFYRSSGTDNDGYADDIQLILYQNRPTFALNRNLVGAPGAETSRYACSWAGSPKRTSSSATNKVGSWMYSGGTASYSSMYQDLQLTDAGPIDRNERAVWASARIGAYGPDNDYATVVLYFYTSSMTYLTSQYLPQVSKADRSSQSKLLERTATKCNLPKYTRIVRFYVNFYRRNGGNNDGWVDQLDLRLVSVAGPSFSWGSNLINAPEADNIAFSCVWTSVSGYTAMARSSTSITGRSGSNYYVGPTSGNGAGEQWIDVSSAQVAIDRKAGVVRYDGLLGGRATSVAEVWVLMASTRSAVSPLQSRKLTQVARGDRSNSDRLQSKEAFECTVPRGTRWIRVRLVLRSGGGGAAMADRQTLALLQGSPPTFGLHSNLVDQPNPQVFFSCAWTGSVATTTRWSISGHYKFASTVTSGSLKQQIDVSAEASWIDARLRSVDLRGGLGGYGSITNAPTVVFSFLKADKTVHDSVTIGPVTKADRGSKTMLLPRAAAAVIPAYTRYIEVQQVFSGSYSMVGDLSVVLRENTLTPSLSVALPATPSASATRYPTPTKTHPPTSSPSTTKTSALSRTSTAAVTQSLSWTLVATGTERASTTLSRTSSGMVSPSGTVQLSLSVSAPATSTPAATASRRLTPTAPHTLTHNPTWTGRPTPTLIPTVSVPITRTPDLPTPAPSPAPTPSPTPAPTPLPSPAPRASSASGSHAAPSAPTSGSTSGASASGSAATPSPSGAAASGSGTTGSSRSGVLPTSASGTSTAPGASSAASGRRSRSTAASNSGPSAASASSSGEGTPAPPPAPTPKPTPAPPPRTRTVTPTIQPPQPPTPAPPEIVPGGLTAAAQATSGVAGTAGVLAASPAAAAQLGRVVAVLFVAEYCGRGALSTTTELPFLLSPTGLGFGPEEGKYYRGAVLGNVALMAGAALIVTAVIGVLRAVHSGSVIEAAAVVLFPSCLLLVVGLLLTGSVLAGVAAGLSGGSPGLDWAMFFVALLVGGGVMAYAVYFSFVGSMMCAVEYVPVDDDADPNRRKRNMCYRFATFVWSDRGTWRPKAQQMDRLDVPRLRMHALLYDKYRGKALQRWLVVDLAGTICVGLAAGIAPASCLAAVWGVALVLIAIAIGAFVTRPYIFTLKNVLFCLVCGLAAIAGLLVAVAVQLGGGKPLPDANKTLLVAAANVVVVCMFFIFISVVVSILKLLTGCRKTSDPKRLNAQFADELEAELRAHGDLLGVRDEIDVDDATELTSGSSTALPDNTSRILGIPLSLNSNEAGHGYTAPAVGTIGGGRQRTMSRVRRAADGFATSDDSSSSGEEAGKPAKRPPPAQRVNPITGTAVPATPATTAAPASDTVSLRPSVTKSKSSRGVMSSSEDSDDASSPATAAKPNPVPADAVPALPLLQRTAPAASILAAPIAARRTTGLTSSDDDDFATSDSGSDSVLGSTTQRNSSIVATTHRTSLGGGTLLGNNASMMSRPSLVSPAAHPAARPATTASGISDFDSDLTEDEDL